MIRLIHACAQVRKVLRCPTNIGITSEGGNGSGIKRIGGPHCVRECGQTGMLWVALKGAVSCHPAVNHSELDQTRVLDRDGNFRPEVHLWQPPVLKGLASLAGAECGSSAVRESCRR